VHVVDSSVVDVCMCARLMTTLICFTIHLLSCFSYFLFNTLSYSEAVTWRSANGEPRLDSNCYYMS